MSVHLIEDRTESGIIMIVSKKSALWKALRMIRSMLQKLNNDVMKARLSWNEEFLDPDRNSWLRYEKLVCR